MTPPARPSSDPTRHPEGVSSANPRPSSDPTRHPDGISSANPRPSSDATHSPDGISSADPFHCVVMLGTDHHPFARLVEWVDRWAGEHPEARCLIQHGTAPAPRHAEGHPTLDPAAIPDLVTRARIVVGHAGPGTILDARAGGRLPVVVPRLARLGEVVDDHQVTFGHWMAERGQALCVEDESALRVHLEAALADPAAYLLSTDPANPIDPARAGGGVAPVPPAVTLFGDLVDGMLRR